MLDMAQKRITGRQLRHKAHEESLAPGETMIITKRDGKVFELKRVDDKPRDILAALDRLFDEIPPVGPRVKVDGAKMVIEDRE
jgi:hypothetical protein